MIDFQTAPRQSGKTSELIKLAKKHNGCLVVHNNNEVKHYKDADYSVITYACLKLENTFSYDWYLFDEFTTQQYISFNKIIELDKLNKNIVIRGTPITSLDTPDYFTDYLKLNYPESLI